MSETKKWTAEELARELDKEREYDHPEDHRDWLGELGVRALVGIVRGLEKIEPTLAMIEERLKELTDATTELDRTLADK